MADWFSSLTNSLSQAKQFTDSMVDSFVASANAAQEELIAEQQKLLVEKQQQKSNSALGQSTLPWETSDESLAILSQDVMEKVLKLGLSERNFTVSIPELENIQFSFKSYIPVAMKLLSLDTNLSRMHTKLSPKMDEEVFWCNYYRKTMYLRAMVGLDGIEAKEQYKHLEAEKIIFAPSFEADYQVRLEMLKEDNKQAAQQQLQQSSASSNSSSSSLIHVNGKTIKEEENQDKIRQKAEELALAAEVEEELKNEDIDLEDLEDLNLDDVEDFENIDDGDDFDSELEAQIAKELKASDK